jgi:hypothetical protein
MESNRKGRDSPKDETRSNLIHDSALDFRIIRPKFYTNGVILLMAISVTITCIDFMQAYMKMSNVV